MKKIITSILLFTLMIFLFGCSNTSLREYKNLSSEQVLVLTTGERYANNTTMVESESYLTKVIARTYTLYRSFNQTGATGEVQYQNYWYRINVIQTTDQELLGKQIITVDTYYAYLIYTENESLSVKKTTVTQTSFDYNGGWIEREYQKVINLNSYFANEAALSSAIPELATQIDSDNIEKYYVDITSPTITAVTYQQINTFYYFD
jgi:uncharacterized protein YcfL